MSMRRGWSAVSFIPLLAFGATTVSAADVDGIQWGALSDQFVIDATGKARTVSNPLARNFGSLCILEDTGIKVSLSSTGRLQAGQTFYKVRDTCVVKYKGKSFPVYSGMSYSELEGKVALVGASLRRVSDRLFAIDGAVGLKGFYFRDDQLYAIVDEQ